MSYILISLSLATLFGLAVNNIYGTKALTDYLWVDYVFWWIIASGVAAAAISPLRERICRRFSCRLPFVCYGPPCR